MIFGLQSSGNKTGEGKGEKSLAERGKMSQWSNGHTDIVKIGLELWAHTDLQFHLFLFPLFANICPINSTPLPKKSIHENLNSDLK